jgi:hypothetical protein
MELQTHGLKKYPTSALLKSSAGLGWSTISAELRSHGVSETPVIVPQHVELCLAVAGSDKGLVRRTGAGQYQETKPTTGAIWLSPIGVGDNEITITAPLPKTMHLYLPTTLFRRLSDDFNLPGAPAHSIRYVAGVRDEVIYQIGLSMLSEMTSETAAGRMFVETGSLALAARLVHKYCDSGSCTLPAPLASAQACAAAPRSRLHFGTSCRRDHAGGLGSGRGSQYVPFRAHVHARHRRFTPPLCQPDAAGERDRRNSSGPVAACTDSLERELLVAGEFYTSISSRDRYDARRISRRH